jgi:hypothetical protein
MESSQRGSYEGTQQRWLGCVAALVAGLLLRAWFIAKYAHIQGDTLLYGDIARNWLLHGVYGFTRVVNGVVVAPRPTLIRLPGYPMFLAVCFKLFGAGRYGVVLWLQAALDLAGCWVVAATARRMLGARAFLPALWLGMLCPFTAAYVASPLTETWTLLCIALAFYALVRWEQAGGRMNRWAWLIGTTLAYAVLLRPEQGMLAACVVPAMAWMEWRRGWRGAARVMTVVSLLTVLPLVPWTVRNERTFHVLQPLAPRYANDPGEFNPYGFQRWFRTWAAGYVATETVYWKYDGDDIRIEDLPARAFDTREQYEATAVLLSDYNVKDTATPTLDARFNAIAGERIRANTLRYYAVLPMARMLNMAFWPRAESLPLPLDWWRFRQHWRDSFECLGLVLVNLGYFALAAVGFRRRKVGAVMQPVVWAMSATIVLRCLLLLTLDNSETRYTLEFFPVVVVFAAGYLQRVSLKS